MTGIELEAVAREVAVLMADSYDAEDFDKMRGITASVRALADIVQLTNPTFDRVPFYAACCMTHEGGFERNGHHHRHGHCHAGSPLVVPTTTTTTVRSFGCDVVRKAS